MKLKVCMNHKNYIYTLNLFCPECKNPTKEAHYKFIKIRDAPKSG